MSKRNFLPTVVLILAATGAFAQTASRPTFEVASVKPVSKIEEASKDPNFAFGMKVTGQQVNIRLPLTALIEQAYGITRDRFEGPEWVLRPHGLVEMDFVDVTAVLPAGATREQVPVMLQALLEERFKLKVHRTSKLRATYALMVGKDGPKLTPKQNAPGSDSSTFVVSTTATSTQIGDARMTQGPMGTYRLEATSMDGLSNLLSAFLSDTPVIPVIDKTGLKGPFDIRFTLEAIGEWNDQLRDEVAKLGLRLEPQKNQIETLVIEHIEKAPTEN